MSDTPLTCQTSRGAHAYAVIRAWNLWGPRYDELILIFAVCYMNSFSLALSYPTFIHVTLISKHGLKTRKKEKQIVTFPFQQNHSR